MAKDCTQIDELMMDFLYQELVGDELAAFRKHVSSCDRCTNELAQFQGVRSAARSLVEADPPPAVSARVMAQAAEAVRPSLASRAWTWLVGALGPMRAHPALAAATALVVVIGVGGLLMRRGYRGESAEKNLSFDDRAGGAPAAQAPEAAAAAAAPDTSGLERDLTMELGAVAPGTGAPEAAPQFEDGDKDGVLDDEARYARLRNEPNALAKPAEAAPVDAIEDQNQRERKMEARAQVKTADGRMAGEAEAAGYAADESAEGVLAENAKPSSRTSTQSGPSADPAPAPATPPSGGAPKPDHFAKAPPPVMAPAPTSPTTSIPSGAARGGGGGNSGGGGATGNTSTGTMGGASGGDVLKQQPAPVIATVPPAAPKIKSPTAKDSNLGGTVPGQTGGSAGKKSGAKESAPAKPQNAQQLQSLADSRRRQGNCMGALYLYDEILRKFPTYANRKVVASSRDKCVANLTGKANRKSGGSSSTTNKAKAAPRTDDAVMSSDSVK